MKQEVDSAVDFLTEILQKRNLGTKVDGFRSSLEQLLCMHYQNHWFPEKPYKGSAYRCMRIVDGKMDPLVAKAGRESGISESQLLNTLPRELTMWVDPDEVSYRIGEDGSVGVIFDRQNGNHVENGDLDIPSRNSSPSVGSPVNSRTPSPVYHHEHQQLQHQQQLQQHYQQSQEFLFPGFHNQQQQQQPQHNYQHHQYQVPESSCRDLNRFYYPDARSQSPAAPVMNWEYLATYVAS